MLFSSAEKQQDEMWLVEALPSVQERDVSVQLE